METARTAARYDDQPIVFFFFGNIITLLFSSSKFRVAHLKPLRCNSRNFDLSVSESWLYNSRLYFDGI